MRREQHRSLGLDGVRGFAALSVFLFHAWLYTKTLAPLDELDRAAFQLRAGLIAFFVLSGYLLYRPFVRAAAERRAPVDVTAYALRRAARILPAYYLALFGAFALLTAAEGTEAVRMPPDETLPLFLVFAQNYSMDSILTLNPVTWTLCLEILFYALLPLAGLFAYRAVRGSFNAQLWMCGALVAAGTGWHALTYYAELNQIASKALIAYIPYFAFGMAAAVLLERRSCTGRGLGRRATLALTLGGAALVAANAVWHALAPGPANDPVVAIGHDLPGGLGFALLIAAAADGAGRSIAWCANRPLGALGTVSYGFYLWHVPLMLFIIHLGVVERAFWPVLLLSFPVALAVSTASWYGLERPVLRATSGRLRVRAQARAGVSARTPAAA